METKIQKWALNALGLFFIFFGTFAMDYAIWRGKPEWAFWICYVAMVLIGFGALLRLPELIASQLVIVAVPLTVWNIDFLYQIISDKRLWGVTDYFFEDMLPVARVISFEHFFLIPFGLLLLFLIKLSRKTFWLISIVQITILYGIIKFFARPAENVSCVFRSCVSFIPDGPWYPLTWFILMFTMIGVVSCLINAGTLFHNRSLKNKST